MRCAYADPPYLGCGAKHYSEHHEAASDWDDPAAHVALVGRLCDEFPDGWALSCSSPSLRVYLPACSADVRIGAWVKPFAVFKANVGVAYAWEPYLWRGGRRVGRDQDTVRDWVAESITLRRGLVGAKPREFCMQIFKTLNLQLGDELVDLFPGTGAVMAAWHEYIGEHDDPQIGLFGRPIPSPEEAA